MTVPATGDRAWPAGVNAGQPFGDLIVIRTGLRGGQTANRPRGFPAALCHCTSCGGPDHHAGCTSDVVVPLYRLLNGNTKSCGCKACFRPRKGGIRDQVAGYVEQEGGAWMTQVRDELGLTDGSAGGHLHYLYAHGRLDRPVRGFYCPPGQVPDPIPPRPGDARSKGNSKAGRARWANMTQPQRDERVAALTAGRVRAAERRERETAAAGGETSVS